MSYLLGLSGSLRREATNRKLLKEAARLFGDCVYTEADLHLPVFDADHRSRARIGKHLHCPYCNSKIG